MSSSPTGATYKTKDEDFLVSDNLDFHPTDVVEDADGSLIVLDTGGWYKICCPTSVMQKPDILGAIYRVKRIGAHKVEDPRGQQMAWQKVDGEKFLALLDDPRPAVRKRAADALATRGNPGFFMTTPSAQGFLEAIGIASRIDDPLARKFVRGASRTMIRASATPRCTPWLCIATRKRSDTSSSY